MIKTTTTSRSGFVFRDSVKALSVMRLLLCFFVAVPLASAHAQTVTTESLLREMADRDSLARFPVPGYIALQSSSYDRESIKPGTAGWSANRDYSQFIRTEQHQGRTEHVMMDAEGPGAVVRIWITWAGRSGKPFSDGTIRLYLDDAEDAVVTAMASEFIDGGPDGSKSPFGGAPFAYGVSERTPHARRGHNLFVPIPYAKSCRITYETNQVMGPHDRLDESFYYHVGYRTYEAGTKLDTFRLANWQSLKSARGKVATKLRSSRAARSEFASRFKPASFRIDAGQRRTFKFDGPAAIESIRIAAKRLTPQQRRSTIVQMSFDGITTVNVPLEGFFTAGYQPQEFQTWMTGFDSGNYTSGWTMPFARQAIVTIKNTSTNTVTIDEAVFVTKPWKWDERSMYFHADWQTSRGQSTGLAKTQDNREGVIDLDFLQVEGTGVLVGDSITLFSGAARWWGEGDEKIYVDGESFPSHFGTGTEDYYGYAWCRPERFSVPFHAQPVGHGALLGGLVVNTRIRSLDAIPFRKSIDFDMELWHWSSTRVNYARTVFWYGRPGAKSTGSTPDLASDPVALKDTDITSVTTLPGAVEGESARVVEVTGGTVEVDRYTLFGWSGGAQLLWKDARPGDKLVLEFETLPKGTNEMRYTIGPDYGQADVSFPDRARKINGRFIGVISVLETRSVEFRVTDNASHRITVTMKGEGDHPQRFGIDAIVPK